MPGPSPPPSTHSSLVLVQTWRSFWSQLRAGNVSWLLSAEVGDRICTRLLTPAKVLKTLRLFLQKWLSPGSHLDDTQTQTLCSTSCTLSRLVIIQLKGVKHIQQLLHTDVPDILVIFLRYAVTRNRFMLFQLRINQLHECKTANRRAFSYQQCLRRLVSPWWDEKRSTDRPFFPQNNNFKVCSRRVDLRLSSLLILSAYSSFTV